MTRALGAIAVAIACAACGGKGEARAPKGPELHVAPATDLAQAAGLVWMIDLAPKAILAAPGMAKVVEAAMPRDEAIAFAAKNGGVDPFDLDELVVATYAQQDAPATLWLARGVFDRGAIEAAFKHRADAVDGRAIDLPGDDGIVRTWGTVGGEREQLALFGANAVGLEIGRFGPLRVAELFAQRRLKRATPALGPGTLASAADLVRNADGSDPPARAFALGPFDGDTGKALGGLLAASTAIAMAARPITSQERPAVALTLVLTGGWEAKAPEAARRLQAAVERATASPLGRLTGADRPLDPVRVEGLPDALRLTATLDALALARGIRAATAAEVREMMSY